MDGIVRVAFTVGELIDMLSDMDREMPVHSTEPPFDCVKLVPQQDGSLMICSNWKPMAAAGGSVSGLGGYLA